MLPRTSLPLYRVLEEEVEFLHGSDQRLVGANATPSDAVRDDAATDDRFLAATAPLNLMGREKLEARIAAQPPESGPRVATSAGQAAPKSEYPYTRLAQWVRAHTDGDVGEALLDKIKLDTNELLAAEPWLRDAALRPYTRGLLKTYFEQRQDQTKPGETTARSTRRIEPWSPEKRRYLNRLLIEDAFVEYIQPDDSRRLREVLVKMGGENQAALCLSGGGIRSATFALGVLQGLARAPLRTSTDPNVLSRFAYLSTVSGGGYLGGWLSAWSHQVGFRRVVEQLKGSRDPAASPLEAEPMPIRHLRQYSNYLSPRLGLFSADTWTLVSTYLRNLLMVWLVVMPFLAAATALPWVVATLAEFRGWGPTTNRVLFYGLLAAAMGLMTYGLHFVHAYFPPRDAPTERAQPVAPASERDQSAFLRRCLVPLALAILLWMFSWRWFNKWEVQIPWPDGWWDRDTVLFMVGGALVHGVSWGIAFMQETRVQKKNPHGGRSVGNRATIFGGIVLTGGIGGYLLLRLGQALNGLAETAGSEFLYPCLAFPGVFLTVLVAGYLFEGGFSRFVKDAQREWMARYGAWILIAAVAWLALTGLVLGGPLLVAHLTDQLRVAAGGVGIGSAVLTALLGQSPKTGGDGEAAGSRRGTGSARDLLGLLSSLTLPLVAIITIVALFVALSLLNAELMRVTADWFGWYAPRSVSGLVSVNPLVPLAIGAGLLGIGFGAAALVNTNRFSLHALYRARLIRAYLGASRPPGERKPNPFTGFDETDNPVVGDLATPPLQPGAGAEKGPFHVVNLALNLVAGQNLAWQERKAESFTVTCLHAGATNLGYRPTSFNGQTDGLENTLYGGTRGISLGTAVTISGAAASPNMGYHSSPVIAFLMTLFNIRLGWWLGNPGPAGDDTFHRSEPRLAVRPIFDELLANTDDVNPYVYLSDGGHFENLGLYEMVLRRNRFILVSDAGCDETCSLEDLGNAIRKIRIDLGIPVEFSTEFKIRARSDDPAAPAGRYWAMGRIRYAVIDGTLPDDDGLILYVKPGFYGHEPRDVFNYASANKAFPHETTGDQFFSESQFESYRALGLHVVTTLQQELGTSVESLFDASVRKKFLQNGTWGPAPARAAATRRAWTADVLGQMLKRYKNPNA